MIQLLWEIEKVIKTLIFFFFSHRNFHKVTNCITRAQMLLGRIFLYSPNKNWTIAAQMQSHTSHKLQFSAQAKYIHHYCVYEFENYLKYHVPNTCSPSWVFVEQSILEAFVCHDVTLRRNIMLLECYINVISIQEYNITLFRKVMRLRWSDIFCNFKLW